MKRILMVCAEFPPANLVGGKRPRLIVNHLKDNGWEPIVLTVTPESYKCKLDERLLDITRKDVEIFRCQIPSGWKTCFINDVGIRSLFSFNKQIATILQKKKIDLVYFPIPLKYATILGPIWKKKYQLPFVLDFIDPWHGPFFPLPSHRKIKSILDGILSRTLEPRVIRHASGVIGINKLYYSDALLRSDPKIPNEAAPYGIETIDHEYAEKHVEIPQFEHLFENHSVFVYAGAFLPRGRKIIDFFFQAIRDLVDAETIDKKKTRFLFLGTVTPALANNSITPIVEIARKHGVQDMVLEIREHQEYLSVLKILSRADGILVMGSTERHYSPSKVFESAYSRSPVFAIVHEASSCIEFLNTVPLTSTVTLSDDAINMHQETITKIRDTFSEFLSHAGKKRSIEDIPKTFSAANTVKTIARFFDTIV